ncbi:MAG: GDP-mannose 4,6-dehydratase [Deltaproteobacteria bacterium]|nr:GDP-mannose 4,6-dehydratase [Deltaproteobacteria bacterium]MBI3294806.1 GDP-mannose 4,6-dehydratase [Deltaproteobacteria bacterium]
MSILITGASGFLGRYLVEHLTQTSSEPVIAVSRRDAKLSKGKATWVQADLADSKSVSALIAQTKPSQVYHLAGHSRVTSTVGMPDYFSANTLTTFRLVDALQRASRPVKFFLASTIHVYGNTEHMASESTPVQPVNDYGFTKYLAEEYLRKRAQEDSNLTILIGRLYNCFGPGQAAGFVSADLCRKIADLPAKGEPVLKVGPTSTFRRFLDVRDAVPILARLMALKAPEGFQIINIASPHEVQIRELISLLLGIAQKKALIESSEDNSANRLFGIRVNCDRLTALVPNAQFRPIQDTLRDMYASC